MPKASHSKEFLLKKGRTMKKTTTQTTKSGLKLKLKLDRETIRSLEKPILQQAAAGSASHYCHSGVSITFCC